jgi:chromate transport protein ChrA
MKMNGCAMVMVGAPASGGRRRQRGRRLDRRAPRRKGRPLARLAHVTNPPSFGEALRVWLKIGLLGFGGPAGQIALLHARVVETRGWIDDDEFARALSFCMLLPGPEAQQLATWLGWRLHGIRGGVAAGLLFVLPGLAVMLGLSALYVAHGRSDWAGPVLLGLKAAVVALVLQALLKIGRRAIKDRLAAFVCRRGLRAAGLHDRAVPAGDPGRRRVGLADRPRRGRERPRRARRTKGRPGRPWSAWPCGWRRSPWPG